MGDLEIIAEIAIAIAGFAGVAYVFGENDSRSDIRSWRIRSLLIASFGTMVAALIPLGLPLLHVPPEEVPRIGSGVLTAITILLLTMIAPGFFKLNVVGRSNIGKKFFYTMLPLTLAMVSIQVANVIGVFGTLADGVMYYGLIMMLIIASAQFIVLIVDAESEGT